MQPAYVRPGLSKVLILHPRATLWGRVSSKPLPDFRRVGGDSQLFILTIV